MRIKSSLISLFTYVMLPTLFVCTSCKRGGGNTSSSREMQVTKTAKDHSENVVKSLTTEQFVNLIADINNDGEWKVFVDPGFYLMPHFFQNVYLL